MYIYLKWNLWKAISYLAETYWKVECYIGFQVKTIFLLEKNLTFQSMFVRVQLRYELL